MSRKVNHDPVRLWRGGGEKCVIKKYKKILKMKPKKSHLGSDPRSAEPGEMCGRG